MTTDPLLDSLEQALNAATKAKAKGINIPVDVFAAIVDRIRKDEEDISLMQKMARPSVS